MKNKKKKDEASEGDSKLEDTEEKDQDQDEDGRVSKSATKEKKNRDTSSEDSEDDEEEETQQQSNEREYIEFAPTEPEIMSLKKMRKLSFHKKFDDAKVIFVHYQYEYSYNHLLQKLLSLVPVMPAGLQALIISMPPDATFLDT